MNTAMQTKKHNDFLLAFIGCECPIIDCNFKEYEESINECHAMLDYSLDIGDRKEVNFWRSQITKIKMEKKAYLEEIKSSKEKLVI